MGKGKRQNFNTPTQNSTTAEVSKKSEPSSIANNILAIITILGMLFMAARDWFITSKRVEDLEKKAESMENKLNKEIKLRTIYWSDAFYYQKDTTSPNYKGKLHYNIENDTLEYPRKYN